LPLGRSRQAVTVSFRRIQVPGLGLRSARASLRGTAWAALCDLPGSAGGSLESERIGRSAEWLGERRKCHLRFQG
jgi:hypothetical protein